MGGVLLWVLLRRRTRTRDYVPLRWLKPFDGQALFSGVLVLLRLVGSWGTRLAGTRRLQQQLFLIMAVCVLLVSASLQLKLPQGGTRPPLAVSPYFVGRTDASSTAGNARILTGSYYTPDSLVQELIRTTLEPVIEQRLVKTLFQKS